MTSPRRPAGPATRPTRVVLITGASSGIGRSVALKLAEPGTALVLAARALAPLERVARQCRAQGAQTLVRSVDVTDAGRVGELFQAAEQAYTRVDEVVHCAAVLAYGRFEDVPADVWETAVNTTLGGSAKVARAALTSFAGRRGNLVFVGSVVGKIAVPTMSSYVTAKWGLHGLVRTLQIEARTTPDIHISLVSPGGVDTPIYRLAGTYLNRHGSPPPPAVTPDRVADAVIACLRHPRRENNVGIANPLIVLGFRLFPALYDALVTPLMTRFALASETVANTEGNVLHPLGQPDLHSLTPPDIDRS